MAKKNNLIIEIDGDSKKLEKAAKKSEDDVKSAAKEMKNDIKDVGKATEKASDKAKTAISSVADKAKTAGKVIGAGFVAAGVAVGAIGTKAVKAYSDFEQLVGGVDTLFKDSSAKVQKYADDAYMTAGLSANQYMDTITSFSASLLQSLGNDTEKAAEYGNQAVIDMSDNANKMGTDMQSIQNAYQGFAKQNYTMLDNLKLGYGGTKEEMQRLLQDAEKLSGIKYDISSFADITQAIHVIQTEMGITGTTAEEAATTIQGSLGMVKASWENLMIGLADPNADLDRLMGNFADSISTFGENLMPVIARIAENLPTVIERLGTQLINGMPGVINNMLPQIAGMASQLITALSTSLSDNAPLIGNCAVDVFTTLINTILQNLPMFLQTGITLILTLAQGLAQAVPDLIPAIINALLAMVDTFLDNIDMMVDTAIELITALADGIIEAVPVLIEKVPEIIIKLVAALVRNYPKMAAAGNEMIGKFFKACWAVFATSWGTMAAYVQKYVVQPVKDKISDMLSVGKNIVEGLWNGITNKGEWLLNKIKSFAHTITQGIKDFFGIKSPSRVMRDEVGKMIALGIAKGIEDNRTEVEKVLDELNQNLLDSEILYNKESERLKNSKDESDRKYLEKLKDTAETERKIYDARQKDIKNAQKEIIDQYKKMAEEVFDAVEEVEKAQESMAEKLKDYGALYTKKDKEIGIEYTFDEGKGVLTGKKKFEEVYELNDLSKQTDDLRKFSDNLTRLKDIKKIPKEFFGVMRDMKVDEGIKFTNALLELSDEDFDGYIAKWIEKQSASEDISKVLYRSEAEEAISGAADKLKEFNAKFEENGEENAESWGEGFIEKMKEIIPDITDRINAAFGSIYLSGAAPAVAAPSGNTYNTSYYIRPSRGESARAQIKAAKDAQTLERMRGGY